MEKKELKESVEKSISLHKKPIFGFILLLIPYGGKIKAYTSFENRSMVDYCLEEMLKKSKEKS